MDNLLLHKEGNVDTNEHCPVHFKVRNTGAFMTKIPQNINFVACLRLN